MRLKAAAIGAGKKGRLAPVAVTPGDRNAAGTQKSSGARRPACARLGPVIAKYACVTGIAEFAGFNTTRGLVSCRRIPRRSFSRCSPEVD
jgi:hypothetical protein